MAPVAVLSAGVTGLIALAVVFSGALFGIVLGRRLPLSHLGAETRSMISVAMAVVGTMSALMLGLLVSNASAAFSTASQEVTQLSADIIRLDDLLGSYGPDTRVAREYLRRYAVAKFDDLFPSERSGRPLVDNPKTVSLLDDLADAILGLKPRDARQHWLVSQAEQILVMMSQTRWLLVEQDARTIPVQVLALIVFWLAILFASFGLVAPRNATAIVTLFVCALAVSGAITAVLELDTPFEGGIRISSGPMQHARDTILK